MRATESIASSNTGTLYRAEQTATQHSTAKTGIICKEDPSLYKNYKERDHDTHNLYPHCIGNMPYCFGNRLFCRRATNNSRAQTAELFYTYPKLTDPGKTKKNTRVSLEIVISFIRLSAARLPLPCYTFYHLIERQKLIQCKP